LKVCAARLVATRCEFPTPTLVSDAPVGMGATRVCEPWRTCTGIAYPTFFEASLTASDRVLSWCLGACSAPLAVLPGSEKNVQRRIAVQREASSRPSRCSDRINADAKAPCDWTTCPDRKKSRPTR
jgi:hypothetical protein